jgi:hypothetical protein
LLSAGSRYIPRRLLVRDILSGRCLALPASLKWGLPRSLPLPRNELQRLATGCHHSMGRLQGPDRRCLAKGKTRVGRLWTYVRDDRPFAGPDPPAAVFFYSRDRGGEHSAQHLAGYAGLMQAATPTPASPSSTRPTANLDLSFELRAGHTAGASSLTWSTRPKRSTTALNRWDAFIRFLDGCSWRAWHAVRATKSAVR